MASVSNVLLIVVDALRLDRVGVYGDSDFTPAIDSLAAEGEVFDSSYACVNATDPSMTTILSGQYPTTHGVLNHSDRITDTEREYAADVTFLSEMIRSSHTTIGIDTLDRWHSKGFDYYHNGARAQNPGAINAAADLLARAPDWIYSPVSRAFQRVRSATADVQTPYVDAPSVTDALLEQLEATGNDSWFAMAHYWDTHVPYVPMNDHPPEIRDRSYPGDTVSLEEVTAVIANSPWQRELLDSLAGDAETVGDMQRKYDAGIARVDNQIDRIVTFLRETGQYDDTAIIITADHGESLTEHDVFFDHHTLYDPSVHVPLIIDAPGFSGRESCFVQHFDLVPTILDLLDRDTEGSFDGISLVPDDGSRDIDRDAVFFEETHTARRRGIRTREHKLIRRLDEGNSCRYCARHHATGDELYALDADPDEKHNRIDANPTIADRLGGRLETWIDTRPSPGRSAVDFEESDEVEQRLEDMGYL